MTYKVGYWKDDSKNDWTYTYVVAYSLGEAIEKLKEKYPNAIVTMVIEDSNEPVIR